VDSPLWQTTHLSEVWKFGTRDLPAGSTVKTDAVKNAAARTPNQRIRVYFCIALPPIAQSAVKSIPHQIEKHLRGSGTEIIYGKSHTYVCPQVLTAVESYLELGHDVPVHSFAIGKFAVRQQFNHGRPLPAEPSTGGEGFTQHCSPENGTICLIRVAGSLMLL
jgi:hypothetical protein